MTNMIVCLAFSPSGYYLAALDSDGNCAIFKYTVGVYASGPCIPKLRLVTRHPVWKLYKHYKISSIYQFFGILHTTASNSQKINFIWLSRLQDSTHIALQYGTYAGYFKWSIYEVTSAITSESMSEPKESLSFCGETKFFDSATQAKALNQIIGIFNT